MKHAITAYVLSATAALAHGGHEAATLQGEVHWLTQVDHLVVLVLGGLAALAVAPVVWTRLRTRRARKA